MKNTQRKFLPALEMMCGDLEPVGFSEFISWATTAVSEHYPSVNEKEKKYAIFFLSVLTADLLPLLYKAEAVGIEKVSDETIRKAISAFTSTFDREGVQNAAMTMFKGFLYESADTPPGEEFVDDVNFHCSFLLKIFERFAECENAPDIPELSEIEIPARKHKATAVVA